MGWAIGFDCNWNRDIGYGVPCTCDYPGCNEQIDRGIAYVCGGEPYGGDDGCGLYFCAEHLFLGVNGKEHQVCERCAKGGEPFEPKSDVAEWMRHKLRDWSWKPWRDENPKEVEQLRLDLRKIANASATADSRSGASPVGVKSEAVNSNSIPSSDGSKR